MKGGISLRLEDEMIKNISQIADEVGVFKPQIIREIIELFPKFIKLFWDNNIETDTYFFSAIQEKIIQKKIDHMKEAGII